jgi:hypothetical protein
MKGALDPTGLTASWLSVRFGSDPMSIDARRRAGQLVAYRPGGGAEHVFPLWQFAPSGEVLPEVEYVLEHARAAGLSGGELVALLSRRVGLTGSERFLDLLLAGGVSHVLAEIDRAAAAAP